MAQNAIPEYSDDLEYTPRRRAPAPPLPSVRDEAPEYEAKPVRRGFLATIDTALIVTVAMLLAIGALMVYSTTFDWSFSDFGGETVILTQHLRNMAIGGLVFLTLVLIDYRVWKRFSMWLLIFTVGSLIAVLVFSDQVFGARRSLLNGSYQPGELAELTVIIYMAAWLSSKGTKVKSFWNGLLPFALLLGLISVLVMLQPDISTAVTMIIASGILYFLAGANIRFLVIIAAVMGTAGFVLSQRLSYAADRLTSFTAGLTDLTQTNYHAQQAIIAFMNGGWTGMGLGQGRQKYGFLPAPHTDSIFAVIGEELGVIGAAFVVFLFIILVFRGFTISGRAKDSFGSLLAAGITVWIITKAMMNIAVMLNLVPATGVALPFISFGGSSLVVVMAGVGLLVSVSRVTARREQSERTSRALNDRGRGDRGTRLSGTRGG
ncbi:MAG TPA: putative peptidoglycan glycosyltransferase FtsW [Candidatus Limnocylindrales bacterium]|nr:putative peptidoglycan glycosyltransferase FtsW [Candidatus Limnocylindrales bacterium]